MLHAAKEWSPRGAASVWAQSSTASRAILVILGFDLRAHFFPVRVGELVQAGEARAVREVARTVHRNGLAGEPFAAVGHEESREVLQLWHLADAAHRVLVVRVLEAAAGPQALGGA